MNRSGAVPSQFLECLVHGHQEWNGSTTEYLIIIFHQLTPLFRRNAAILPRRHEAPSLSISLLSLPPSLSPYHLLGGLVEAGASDGASSRCRVVEAGAGKRRRVLRGAASRWRTHKHRRCTCRRRSRHASGVGAGVGTCATVERQRVLRKIYRRGKRIGWLMSRPDYDGR